MKAVYKPLNVNSGSGIEFAAGIKKPYVIVYVLAYAFFKLISCFIVRLSVITRVFL